MSSKATPYLKLPDRVHVSIIRHNLLSKFVINQAECMADFFERAAAQQKAEAQLGKQFSDSITRAVESFGSGSAFDYKDGECRVKVNHGIPTLDYVHPKQGLVWSLTATGGHYGQVSFSPSSQTWHDRNDVSREVNEALTKLTDAVFEGKFRTASPGDVPSLSGTLSPLPRRALGSEEAFIDRGIAWRQLDQLLNEKGTNSISFPTTTDAQAKTLGYRQTISIFRTEEGDIYVQQSLPPRANGIVGPRFRIPKDPSEPIEYYPGMDDCLQRVVEQDRNVALLNSWLSSVKLG